jgi:two-component system, NtrC family, response regulator AtoC
VKSLCLALTVTSNAGTRSTVKSVLVDAGHRVIEVDGCAQAELLAGSGLEPDLVLIEPVTGNGEVGEWMRLAALVGPENLCLILEPGDARMRQEAIALGVKHVLLKPISRVDIELIAGAGEFSAVRYPDAANCPGSPQIAAPAVDFTSGPLIEELGEDRYFLAASPAMYEIHRQAKLLADVDVTVLILGESGTGKEVVAHLIHKYSQRSRQKLLSVNCAALPAELLESELFGHQQGAFTGAIKDRAGRFEQANRGTLLLDEIGEISAQMQAKLLHVLQDGRFTRLGGQESTRVDVRILAATNVQMESALDEKRFREDLYYRLSAFTIQVPPLRERREEIPYLIEETIRRTPAQMKGGADCGFSSRLIDAAVQYEWRGNLRELRNFVIRTIIMRDQVAAIRELEAKIESRDAVENGVDDPALHRSGMRSIVRDIKERTEVRMIQEALEASGWNRRHAAKNLNISYRTLLYKIQQHRLAPRLVREGGQDYRKAYSARGSAV